MYNRGDHFGGSKLSLVFVKGKSLKIGFSVSNKVGHAVVRNKLKRRLRAVCRVLAPTLEKAQIVIVAKPAAADMTYDDINKEVTRLFNKAKLFKNVTE